MRPRRATPRRAWLAIASALLFGVMSACGNLEAKLHDIIEAWTTSALESDDDNGERRSMLTTVEPLPMLERVMADHRASPPPPPHSIRDLVRRFLPGWQLHRAPPAFRLFEGQRFRFELPVHAGVCYGIAGFSGEIEHLDIDVHSQGERWAQDFRDDPYPVTTFCAPVTALLSVELRSMRGAGEANVMILREPSSWRAFAPPQSDLRGIGDSHTPLERKLTSLAAEIAPHAQPAMETRFIELQHREALTEPLGVIEPGCHVVLVAALPPLESIALRVYDYFEYNAEDRQHGPSASALICVESSRPIWAEVAPLKGTGLAAIGILKVP